MDILKEITFPFIKFSDVCHIIHSDDSYLCKWRLFRTVLGNSQFGLLCILEQREILSDRSSVKTVLGNILVQTRWEHFAIKHPTVTDSGWKLKEWTSEKAGLFSQNSEAKVCEH